MHTFIRYRSLLARIYDFKNICIFVQKHLYLLLKYVILVLSVFITDRYEMEIGYERKVNCNCLIPKNDCSGYL